MNKEETSLIINTIVAQKCIDNGEFESAKKFIEVIEKHDLNEEQANIVKFVKRSVENAINGEQN